MVFKTKKRKGKEKEVRFDPTLPLARIGLSIDKTASLFMGLSQHQNSKFSSK